VRATKKSQAQNGKRVNGACPYGYIPCSEDRHKLLPDQETAPVVQMVFEMFVNGKKISEIQRFLFIQKHITPNAIRFQRTGQKTYGRALENPYSWSDKTLYDMLVRREYLGHTYTSKTRKMSYKIKKTIKHPLDEQFEFLNTHEALVSEEVFQIAQKRISERNRPMRDAEIDIYSGLLFCRDCGSRMYVQRGIKNQTIKHAYTCATYRNARTKYDRRCSTHYIRKIALDAMVLSDIQRVFGYLATNKAGFLASTKNKQEKQLEKSVAKSRGEHQQSKARLAELDTIFRRLYEDQIFGKITETQFAAMTANYSDEREKLTTKIAEVEHLLKQKDQQRSNTAAFIKVVEKHENVDELTFELLHEFIDKIYIHETDKENNTRQIDIVYNFVGDIGSGDDF